MGSAFHTRNVISRLSLLGAALVLCLSCTRLPIEPTTVACTGRWIRKSAERLRCAPAPRNVILFIGDGMGFEQVRAGGLYAHGRAGSLAFESMPRRGSMTTCSADDAVTDSAAAATAMATGLKVANNVLALELPGTGNPVPTITEQFHATGKRIGLVTTTDITHATPAAFALHLRQRYLEDELTGALLAGYRPDVLLGGAEFATREDARGAGYRVVESRAEFEAIDPATTKKLWGMFGEDHLPYAREGMGQLPDLAQMTGVALAVLEQGEAGFFLMVEGGRIDHAGHENDIELLGPEMAAFEKAIEVARAWAEDRDDTLILITADHETGGLKIEEDAGGWPPAHTWQHEHHTAAMVPIYASGPNSELVRPGLDNTDIFRIMGGCPIPRPE